MGIPKVRGVQRELIRMIRAIRNKDPIGPDRIQRREIINSNG